MNRMDGIDSNKKAVIHIAKNQLGMDNETYRDFLYAHAGVRSSTNLTPETFRAVVKAFERAGFKGLKKKSGMISVGQYDKITRLWGDVARNPSPHALRSFVEKRFGVSDPKFLTLHKAQAVIEALKRMKGRDQGPGTRGRGTEKKNAN